MAARQVDNDGGPDLPLRALAGLSMSELNPSQRRLLIETAARARATQEEIEAAGIRPDVVQIVRYMKDETPAHPCKRARLNDSTARRIYLSRSPHDQQPDKPDNYEETLFEDEWQALLAEQGLQDTDASLLDEFRQIAYGRIRLLDQGTAEWDAALPAPRIERFDLIGSLSSCTELIVEVCRHLRPKDIVNLYCVCRDFHDTIDQHMRSSVWAWARVMAPSSARIYSSPVYYRWFISDPAGRPVTRDDQELGEPQPGQAKMMGHPPLNDVTGEVRLIPGLRWLQMVVNCEIRVRDILATLARMGHRMPADAHLTLKKLWLVMDASTSRGRLLLMNNPTFFTKEDLYIAQLFMVKLVLAFNDPVFGPQSSTLMRLMMGQRSLSTLWALLRGKKYRTPQEIRELKLRYDVGPSPAIIKAGVPFHGVEIYELGVVHFEGWGKGAEHLMRPDELVPVEAARRQLDLDLCINEMLIYGHVDLRTGNSLVPSVEEMYMSDDELPPAHRDWTPMRHELINGGCGNVPFESKMWQPKHARKARWKTLTDEEKEMILKEEKWEMDEAAELDSARFEYQAARARLAAMTQHSLSARRPRDKLMVFPPGPDDLAELLHEFEKPKHPNSDDTLDAMDDDSEAPPSFSTLPLPMQAQMAFGTVPPGSVYQPLTGDQMRAALHGTMSSLGPSHMWESEPQKQEEEGMEGDDERGDDGQSSPSSPSSLSSISSTNLELEPIPRSELQRMYVAFRPARPPQQQQQHRQGEDDQEDWNALLPSPSFSLLYSFPSSEGADEEDQDQDRDHEMPDQPGPDGPIYGGHFPLPSLSDVAPATLASTSITISSPRQLTTVTTTTTTITTTTTTTPPPPPPAPTAVMTPAIMLMTTDDMLLAQADQVYSPSDLDDPDSEPDMANAMAGSRGNNNSTSHGGGGGGGRRVTLDWDDFLRNPGGYTLEADGEDGDGEGEDEEEEDDDDEDEGDGDGMNGEGGVTAIENLALAQGGGENMSRYRVDEDLGEDDMTRKLRDWYRPW